MRKWIDTEVPLLTVSVNLSRLHFMEKNFLDEFDAIRQKYDVPAKYLEFELTERTVFEETELLTDVMYHMREKGYSCSLDDFGSGYSSLNILLETPFDVIKLDKKFMENMMVSNKGRLILEQVVLMASKLELGILAEGVETKEQVELLRSIGCDQVQGYYYAKPMPPDEFEAYMLRHNVLDKIDEISSDGLYGLKFKKSQGVMLIVDDLALNRKILSTSFASYFQIVEKENGAEALEYIKENYNNIDVIMLDLVMPVMDGFTLMRHLGVDERYKKIPVIVTSQGGEKSVEKSFALGATDFVEKPYNLRIILHRVQNVVMASRK